MIVNNHGSNISTQNNIEISANDGAAIKLLQQISGTLTSDHTLGPSQRAAAEEAVAKTSRELSEGTATRQTLLSSLGALAGIGSVAGLVSKLIDLF